MRTCVYLRLIPGLLGRVENAVNERRRGVCSFALVRMSIRCEVRSDQTMLPFVVMLCGSVALLSAHLMIQVAWWYYWVLAQWCSDGPMACFPCNSRFFAPLILCNPCLALWKLWLSSSNKSVTRNFLTCSDPIQHYRTLIGQQFEDIRRGCIRKNHKYKSVHNMPS